MDPAERVTDIGSTSQSRFFKRMGIWLWVWIIAGIVLDAAIIWYLLIPYFTGPTSGGDGLDGVLFILLLPWIALAGVWGVIANKVRTDFWKQFAVDHGWEYSPYFSYRNKRALLLKEGHTRTTTYSVAGLWNTLPLRISEYSFSKGSGKSKRDFSFTLFEFRFAGSFPHLYLDHKGGYNFSRGKKLSLPPSLEKNFTLYVPDQYEIEALEIFTPDVLALIEDLDWPYDLELVDQSLIVYIPGQVNSRDELGQHLLKATTLADRLAPVLSQVQYAAIGTNSDRL